MRNFKYSIIASIILSIALAACGGDSGTSANDDVEKSSSSSEKVSSSSVIPASSGNRPSSSSKKGDAGTHSSSSGQAPSGMTSSSSSKVSSSSAKATSSSSVKAVSSSSSVIPASSGNLPSSSSKKVESSSSQKIASSSSVSPASSSSKNVSSSSEYVPYDHSTCLAWNWNIEKDVYKQFTDPRNGRSYYYYTAVSSKTGEKVTVMAENLNIGEMVLGENEQNDDTKIERYCYNNDTTNCDKYGGLYQWAEMMQLPSRCNTESCSDYIRRKHQGICPDGWRLFTWNDYEIIRDYNDQYGDGVKGLRSQCFQGKNTSGFSLIGAGLRNVDGEFEKIDGFAAWFRPEEYEEDKEIRAHHGLISALNENPVSKNHRELKANGFSVRCTKIE
ncbi:FISUMP domain-containing protein [Fibrobacter sp. UWB7]|uniref:FISUMP domain-containing protein n=1 Tax=Fibrobacter sp. UWB7 TaxID=1896206 RepID=UPI00092026C8|nr:FISUMP domain-containing protein [Fibrobacter sp. UWB7]SHM46937.1 major paralogous domain-containing protein [Fibrobacter sp. UWB7]